MPSSPLYKDAAPFRLPVTLYADGLHNITAGTVRKPLQALCHIVF